ncbi:TPA_asm: hypothetical protein GZQ63_12650 [Listeria monocytogenes]|nr:hypothetical protein [Listeria monocytogenes]HAB6531043.1 hypothetical protein [Listeria monocytogenes]HAC4157548.1 hypothetical protein [Listeria monocytogenes]HAC4187453.1 hypothetical protein [Listeria monocytogenes]
MKQGQWMLNGSYGGRWESITYFDTKEEAIKHGINLLKKYNHNTHDEKTRNQVMNDLTIYSYYNELIYTFFVGEIEEIAFPDETDSLLENIAERVYSEAGEYTEGFLDDVTDEHQNELAALIRDWAERHDYLPGCFLIREIEEIDIRNFEEVSE